VIAFLGCGALVGAAAGHASHPRFAAGVAFVGLLPVWAFYASAAVTPLVEARSDQRLQVVFLQWDPGVGGPTVGPTNDLLSMIYPGELISSADLDELSAANVTGTLKVTQVWETGKGPAARMLVVMSGQLEVPQVELREPQAAHVIYVQRGGAWEMHPPDAPTIARTVQLRILDDIPQQTTFLVEAANGSRSGATAINWRPGSPGAGG
jgi:hypothetical protein